MGGEARADGYIRLKYENPTARADIYKGIGEEMKEYARLWPTWVDIHRWRLSVSCRPGESNAECVLWQVDDLYWGVEAILDSVKSYDSLFLMAGNSETRRTITGWAGWTQLWPEAQDEPGSTAGERDGPPTSFDVSGVDTTNFPELECSLVNYSDACEYWWRNAERGRDGVVGVRSTTPSLGEGVLYIQLYRDPDDPEAFEVTKAEILRLKPADWEEQEWVIVPVNHSYPDLWKWGLILNRFAETTGNTIGILYASVHDNSSAGFASSELGLYLQDGTENVWSEGRGYHDHGLLRESVAILALDPYVVRDALPVLLPQLGIPIDAVGVILKESQRYVRIYPTGDSNQDTGDKDDLSAESANSSGKEESTDSVDTAEPETMDTDELSESSSDAVDATQPEAVDTDDLSGPAKDTDTPGVEDGSGLSPWALIVIVVGGVALVLISAVLARAKFRRPAY